MTPAEEHAALVRVLSDAAADAGVELTPAAAHRIAAFVRGHGITIADRTAGNCWYCPTCRERYTIGPESKLIPAPRVFMGRQ